MSHPAPEPEELSERFQAALLARAVTRAVNPPCPHHDAGVGNAMLAAMYHPLMERVILLLHQQGYRVVGDPDHVHAPRLTAVPSRQPQLDAAGTENRA